MENPGASGTMSSAEEGLIKSIDSDSIHRIHSGQVVLGLDGALKELVENSIDAGATSIDVKIKDNGTENFEVSDNGAGIREVDWSSIALKHHTSKITSFDDLSRVDTFGFRGEALSALCALSESVTVCTSTQETQPLGRILKFGRDGHLADSTAKTARQRGTTVTVEKLFAPLPVRRKEFERNAKREFAKALSLLTAYALVPSCHPRVEGNQLGTGAAARGIRLTVDAINKNGRKTNHLKSDGKGSLRSAVSAVWGNSALDPLIDVDMALEVEIDKGMAKREGLDITSKKIRVTGLISAASFGSGRTNSDRQYYYLNGRPFVATKIARAVNELYKSYNTNQSPFVVLDIQTPLDAVDVNVSPDKREIFVHSENNLIEALKTGLEELYEPSRSTYLEQNVPTPPRPPPTSNAASTKPLFLDEDEEDEDLQQQPSTRRPAAGSKSSQTSVAGIFTKSDKATISQSTLPKRSRDRSPIQPELSRSGLAPQPSGMLGTRLPTNNASHRPEDRILPETHFSPTPKKILEYQEEDEEDGFSQDEEVRLVLDKNSAEQPASTKPPTRRLLQTKLTNVIYRGDLERSDPEVSIAEPSERSTAEGRSSRTRLRSMIAGFASQGGVVDVDELDSDSDDRQVTVMTDRQSTLSPDVEDTVACEPEEEVETPAPSARPDRSTHLRKEIDADKSLDGDIVMATQEEEVELQEDTSAHVINNNQYILQGRDEDIVYLADSATSIPEQEAQSEFRDEILKATPQGQVVVRCDVDRIRSRTRKRRTLETSPTNKKIKLGENDILPEAGIANTDAAQVDRVLSRVIQKQDFAEMEILGQYNLAFIIARRKKVETDGQCIDDIFIIDQHASDEKYNFETLQTTTRIRSQGLLQPKPLQLPSADEITAMENLDILAANGFGLSVDEDAPYGRGERIRLTSMPISKETVFDVSDLEELIFLLQDHYIGSMVRSKKARAMFAMRACRKSVMFGNALSRSQMIQILRHMGTIDQPWNCPHGRPTMRHLINLARWAENRGDSSNAIDWSSVDLTM